MTAIGACALVVWGYIEKLRGSEIVFLGLCSWAVSLVIWGKVKPRITRSNNPGQVGIGHPSPEAYTTSFWKGQKRYRCPHCPYDTYDEKALAEHAKWCPTGRATSNS